ncbi:MAG: prolyl oligopeptidase family serine peptidase [bacterium]|nr:prolyl oligopeptidase family serine peptidase [bacterium]
MRVEEVSFYSEGDRVSAILRLPDRSADAPYPAVVQGPGWLGLKDAQLYLPYHEALTAAGIAVLILDFRGFGSSEGASDLLLPSRQLEDLINAVTYVASRSDIDEDSIGTFGSGGTGGGNAIMLAAADSRIRCAVSQVPVADGEDWLRRMRREYEWYELLESLRADRAERVLTGKSRLVHPREDIMLQTPERRTTKVKKDVDSRVPTLVQLRSVDGILAYKPIEVVGSIEDAPLLIVGVENDPVTPTDHAVALYERAHPPKKLLMQRHTTHYGAYAQYADTVVPQITDWFGTYLRREPVTMDHDPGATT